MQIAELIARYAIHPKMDVLVKELKKKNPHTLVQNLCGSARALVVASVFIRNKRTILLAVEDQEKASYLQHDLQVLLQDQDGKAPVYIFPTTHRIRQKGQDESYTIQRTEVLQVLNKQHTSQDGQPLIVLTYPDALCESTITQEALTSRSISVQRGQRIQEKELILQLSDLGFVRVDFVYEPGQFAVRGGIFDIYSFSAEKPYRLDFFGDEIDTIRIFDIETQLSEQKVESAEIVARCSQTEAAQEAYLTDYLPQDTLLCGEDFNLLFKTVYVEQVNECLSQYASLEMAQRSYFGTHAKLAFDTTPQPIFHKNFDMLLEEMLLKKEDGYQLCILSDSRKQTDRLGNILDSLRGIEVDLDGKPLQETEHLFQAVFPTLHEGFVDHDIKVCYFTDHQIFERYHKVEQRQDKARQGKVLITLRELNQLQVGDYVVHQDHGIGKFGGLVRTTVNGKPQEMIRIGYKDGAFIFVSIHSLHKISKYRGKEGAEPNISKLGSGQWERMKERTKQKVKDIARDLIRLYAARRKEEGYAYSPDSFMQQELEASFIYEDTPDQAKATLDLKHDMESPRPMDRLICGDVGFGKTELAMRAAFKAACDSKQVAVLVPTTVLALQHYQSFKERFSAFPVRVEYLTRAKSPKEQKTILADLEAGKIDVIIGTHKLVGKAVKFKDLGLLIIDEEQKFGVAVKEKLRSLKVNVDTLTLTATPIPRTLQFSLLGARDLSIMSTPPQNRYPIQTEVITPADEDILREALQLEMNRNGQVFYIHNRVATLDMVAHQLQKLCPDARIVTAHGQMPPEEVEQILTDFVNFDYDILVATSIIENGVDIPNANTIIIGGAQHYGLSDLHQMRGRVGRSNRKAYCYLVAPSSELLTPEARRRLSALETFSDLGSGFHLAMQDLDIRGAGNLLGAEQSGFIADLGYETYQRILSEAVQELKEDEFQELFKEDVRDEHSGQNWISDSQLDSDIEIGFPPEYIENISERITLYRELDSIQNEDAMLEFKKRLIDRFGVIPEAGEELLQVVRLRWLCIRMGIEKIVLKQGKMVCFFPNNPQSPYYQSPVFERLLKYVGMRPQRCQFREKDGKRSLIISDVKTVYGAYTLLSKINEL